MGQYTPDGSVGGHGCRPGGGGGGAVLLVLQLRAVRAHGGGRRAGLPRLRRRLPGADGRAAAAQGRRARHPSSDAAPPRTRPPRSGHATSSFELFYDDGAGSGLRPLPESMSDFLMGSGFERLLEQLARRRRLSARRDNRRPQCLPSPCPPSSLHRHASATPIKSARRPSSWATRPGRCPAATCTTRTASCRGSRCATRELLEHKEPRGGRGVAGRDGG
ncbi:hypothetical protein ZWY2020_049045 [Hordeum vulgare]|nr:hypothetical protein ZWY2020_049045 [Hordeum vulgare]